MKGTSFASGKRFRLNHDINVVGPGAYDIAESKGKGASIGRSRFRDKNSLTPGPGAYDLGTSFDGGRSSQMGSKFKSRALN